MRMYALAQALMKHQHRVVLIGDLTPFKWIQEIFGELAIDVIYAPNEAIFLSQLLNISPELVVLDSYIFSYEFRVKVSNRWKVVSVVDEEDQSIFADCLINQNLGSKLRFNPMLDEARTPKLLVGSNFALIREEIVAMRSNWKPRLLSVPRILVLSGGADTLGASAFFSSLLARIPLRMEAVFVADSSNEGSILANRTKLHDFRFVDNKSKLYDILSDADMVISAAGTTSWELATIGIPMCLASLVSNQVFVERTCVEHGIAVGLGDLFSNADVSQKLEKLRMFIENRDVRASLSEKCHEYFDGNGADRVAKELGCLV